MNYDSLYVAINYLSHIPFASSIKIKTRYFIKDILKNLLQFSMSDLPQQIKYYCQG